MKVAQTLLSLLRRRVPTVGFREWGFRRSPTHLNRRFAPCMAKNKNAAQQFAGPRDFFSSNRYFITSLLRYFALPPSFPQKTKSQPSGTLFRGANGIGVFGPSPFGVTAVSGFPGSSSRTIY